MELYECMSALIYTVSGNSSYMKLVFSPHLELLKALVTVHVVTGP